MLMEMQVIALLGAFDRSEITTLLTDIANTPEGKSPLIRFRAVTVSAGIHGVIVTGELPPFRNKLHQLYYQREGQG